MTTTNHTSPSGEDAANGAMGEREAFEAEWKRAGWGDADTKKQCFHFWQARAALPAENVAAEPISDDHAATLWRLARMTDAAEWTAEFRKAVAPQQPAQSAEQDERVTQWQSRVRNVSCSEWINITEEGAATIREKYSDAYELRALFDRAASTQSTTTQPAQTQVALTDEQRKSVWWAVLEAEKDEPEPGSLMHRRASDLRALLGEK